MIFNKTVRNISRISEVINILLKYSFEDIVTTTALKRFIPAKQQLSWTHADKSIFEFTRFERIRMVIEELGPTYIKLAQMLSNRPDIIPAKLIDQFEKLQNDVPPISYKIAREIIEKELDKNIVEVFSFFDTMPLGSASIGQVYRARLIDGTDVAVKIQRPGVVEKVKTDLALLREIISLTESYFINQGILNPLDVVDTFELSLLQELDYNSELDNIVHFQKVYKYYEGFKIPKVYKELSGKKILVMEFISGCKVDDLNTIISWGLNPRKIAKKTISIYLTQIFEYGFFHGDPHPGNVLVQPDGTIALIDFGMVGKLTKKQKFAFAGLMLGFAQEDYRALASNIRRLAANSEIKDMRKFENQLEELIEEFRFMEIKEIDLSDLTVKLQNIIYEYKLHVPGIIFIMFRAFAILEGIGNKLDPKFNFIKVMRPFGANIIAQQYNPANIQADIKYNISHLASLFYSSPIDIKYILKKLRAGDLQTNINIGGLEPAILKAESIANRFMLTFIIVALLIGSAIIYTSTTVHNKQIFWGIPLIPFIGFSIAVVLIFVLFLSIIRNRKKI